MDTVNEKAAKDIGILADLIELYCREHHEGSVEAVAGAKIGEALGERNVRLCDDCRKLLMYAGSMRLICPYEPKPSCKKCETHCYKPEYREKIRKVMRFSGMYLIRHGKLGLIKKYLF